MMIEERRVRVVQVEAITPHPDADRLDLLRLTREGWNQQVVAGRHYQPGQLGLYLPPGCLIPGWLAQEMWLCGDANANRWVVVSTKVMRGVASPGLFAGAVLRNHPSKPFAAWSMWQARWRLGDDVTDWLGVLAAQVHCHAEHGLCPEEPVLATLWDDGLLFYYCRRDGQDILSRNSRFLVHSWPYSNPAQVAQSSERPVVNRGVEEQRPSLGSSVIDRR